MQLRQVVSEPDVLVVVERGEDIPDVIQDICLKKDLTTTLVEGSGRALWIVLDSGPVGRRRIDGPLELLSLRGTLEQKGSRLEPSLRCVASRELDTGPQLVGGLLIEAKLESGLFRISRHLPAGRLPTDTSGSSWNAVAAVSADLEEPEEDGEVHPRPGDTVDHPKFGQCVVRGIDDDHVRVRLDTGRTISLGLSRVSFSLKGELSKGKKIFSIQVGKSR